MADDTRQTNGSGPAEGARRATGAGPERAAVAGPLEPKQRWTVTRKRELVLRLLRGEPVDAVGREVGVETYRLEEWKDKALLGMDASLRERDGDPLEKELQSARSKLGELMMDIELLREKTRRPGPLAKGRLRT
jgi:transposase